MILTWAIEKRAAANRHPRGPYGRQNRPNIFRSLKQREKIRQTLLGRTLPPEHKENIRQGLLKAYAEGRR